MFAPHHGHHGPAADYYPARPTYDQAYPASPIYPVHSAPVACPVNAPVPAPVQVVDYRRPLMSSFVSSVIAFIVSLFTSIFVLIIPIECALYGANTALTFWMQAISGSVNDGFFAILPLFVLVVGLIASDAISHTASSQVFFVGWFTWAVLTLMRWPMWRNSIGLCLAVAALAVGALAALVLVPLAIADVYERCSASTLYDEEKDWTPSYKESMGWRIRDLEEAFLAFVRGQTVTTFRAAFSSKADYDSSTFFARDPENAKRYRSFQLMRMYGVRTSDPATFRPRIIGVIFCPTTDVSENVWIETCTYPRRSTGQRLAARISAISSVVGAWLACHSAVASRWLALEVAAVFVPVSAAFLSVLGTAAGVASSVPATAACLLAAFLRFAADMSLVVLDMLAVEVRAHAAFGKDFFREFVVEPVVAYSRERTAQAAQASRELFGAMARVAGHVVRAVLAEVKEVVAEIATATCAYPANMFRLVLACARAAHESFDNVADLLFAVDRAFVTEAIDNVVADYRAMAFFLLAPVAAVLVPVVRRIARVAYVAVCLMAYLVVVAWSAVVAVAPYVWQLVSLLPLAIRPLSTLAVHGGIGLGMIAMGLAYAALCAVHVFFVATAIGHIGLLIFIVGTINAPLGLVHVIGAIWAAVACLSPFLAKLE